MTSSRATEHLVEPIEAWLRQFDDLDLKSAPEDFLVGLGSIRKAFVDFYEEGTPAAPLQLLTSLAASEYTLAEEARWIREHGIEPLQPLSPHWLPIVAARSPEFRLAAALNSLEPIATDDDVITARSHMESIRTRIVDAPDPDTHFDDEVGFSRRTRVTWRGDQSAERVWDKQDEVDGLAAILERRFDSAHGPEFVHAGRGQIAAAVGNISAFIRGTTDEGRFSRLAFVLAILDLSVIETDFDPPSPDLDGVDPDWALLKLALSRPWLPNGNERLPIERDIHLLALKGNRESTLEFARAHLRTHGLEPRADLPESKADFDRIVAACAFPVSPATLSALTDHVIERDS